MILNDLTYLIGTETRVELLIDNPNPEYDTKVIGPTTWGKIGYRGYEVIDLYPAKAGVLVIRCLDKEKPTLEV